MPFVDLSNPDPNAGQNTIPQSPNPSPIPGVPSDLNMNPVNSTPPPSPTGIPDPVVAVNKPEEKVEMQPVVDQEKNEEHSLLRKAPEELKETTPNNGIIEIKGPPLPSQSDNSMNSLPDLNTIPSPINNPVSNTPVSQPNELPDLDDLISKASADPVENLSASGPTTLPTVSPVPVNPQPSVQTSSVLPNLPSDNLVTQTPSPIPPTPTLPGTSDLPPLESILNKDYDVPANPQSTNGKSINAPRIISTFDAQTSDMEGFMSYTIANNSSDLHLTSENESFIRVDGALKPIPNSKLSPDKVKSLVEQIVSKEQMADFLKNKELDLSYQHSSGDRFRVNVFFEKGKIAVALRLIPNKIRSISELGMPNILYDFTKIPHGLVIVTGPTGSGKSTTIASMIQEINVSRSEHIITVEDPIEYVFPRRKSLIEQRELGRDTLKWSNALRSVLRQDPNIVLVGEMRDYETIGAAVTVAETGHLVFATLHTNSASQTIDRVIDVFPEGQQAQIRAQLANVIAAVISQRLVPVKSGGRKAVLEIMIGNSAIRNAIREGKTYQIDNIIQTNVELGMQTLESSLAALVRAGELTAEDAQNYTVKPDELLALLQG